VLHPNAPLSPEGRFRLVRLVEDGWPVARAAERLQVSRTTAYRWVGRYRQLGRAGLVDRPCRPHRMPRLTPAPLVRKIVHLRTTRRWGPVAIGARLGLAASTVHRVLVRCHLNRLAWMDRATGQLVRRYEHPRPGDLIHIDVKKLGNIPQGGGHRVHGRQLGRRYSQADHTSGRRSAHSHPLRGYGYVHAAVDDHSRLAYVEVHPDEQAATACGFWTRARAWFAECGITVQRVLTDNGACYRSNAWRQLLQRQGVTHKRTRPYRPATNGKVERFNRTLLAEWAYALPYRSEQARRAALPAWLHRYNHHRPHTALGGRPPASRVPNLPGQNS
jgi:Integrase core domain/leucine-zipper of insertion element IS481